jgi:hypothetical protein
VRGVERGQFQAQFIDLLQQAPAIQRYGEKRPFVVATTSIPGTNNVQFFGSHFEFVRHAGALNT